MLMNNFLRDRRSFREFRNKKAKDEILNKVVESIDEVLKEAKSESVNIGLTLHIDGEKIFKELENIGGYSGVMIKSPHYIGLEIKDSAECTEIYAAYYSEKLITKINAAGLEACWITLTHVDDDKKVEALGEQGKITEYALAIGYPPRKNPFTKEVTPSDRLGVEEIVFQDKVENPINMNVLDERSIDDLFYYVRFAPSSRNSQPWRFLLKNNKVILLMSYRKESDLSLIDAGVMMYYFEEMAKSIGINHSWKLIEGNCEGNLASYRYIAEYEI